MRGQMCQPRWWDKSEQMHAVLRPAGDQLFDTRARRAPAAVVGGDGIESPILIVRGKGSSLTRECVRSTGGDIAPGGDRLVHALLMRPIRPLPACCSQRAATLKPEQMQQRLVRQFYPVVSFKNLRSFTANAVLVACCPS